MEQPLFSGVCTALVTPFLNGQVNYPMLAVLLQRQMDAGIKAVVLAGTTGESATLLDEEATELVRFSKSYVGSRMLIIAGTGSNSTEHAVLKSIAAEKAGADALLVVSPYYNKATAEGLIAHFTVIAESVQIPIILYNVPSRTGVDIPVSVYQSLSTVPNIVGVKEAVNDPGKILRIRGKCLDSFHIWSGNDEMTIPFAAVGASGVISVISNLFPEEMAFMTDSALKGDYKAAAAIQQRMLPWTEFLSCEVNPIPAKAAMKALGLDCGTCRLPLTELTPQHHSTLSRLLN